MPAQYIEDILCPHGHEKIDSADKFCGQCGTPMLADPGIERAICADCFSLTSTYDRFCRRCGSETNSSNAESIWNDGQIGSERSSVVSSPGKQPNSLDSPWFVLLMLFIVLGPLGLPLLWRSARFSIFWKVLLTSALAMITGCVLLSIWQVAQMSLGPLLQLSQFKL